MLGIISCSYNPQVHNYKQYHYSLLLVRVLTMFLMSHVSRKHKNQRNRICISQSICHYFNRACVLVEFFILNLLLINKCNHYRRNFVLLNKAHNLYEILSHAIKPKHVPEFLNLRLHLQEILNICIRNLLSHSCKMKLFCLKGLR